MTYTFFPSTSCEAEIPLKVKVILNSTSSLFTGFVVWEGFVEGDDELVGDDEFEGILVLLGSSYSPQLTREKTNSNNKHHYYRLNW